MEKVFKIEGENITAKQLQFAFQAVYLKKIEVTELTEPQLDWSNTDSTEPLTQVRTK